MSYDFKVKCAVCGCPNELRVGRVYQRLLCKQCNAEIDTDASVTLEILFEEKPITLKRDTVTVGFRSRELSDWIKCPACGTKAELQTEDVLESDRIYKCTNCGKEFQIEESEACSACV